jgi:benzaldehyde dehydrogenase (NAD)
VIWLTEPATALADLWPALPSPEATAPFGGIGQSGLGGRSGGDEFTERRWLTVNSEPVHYPY